MLQRDDFRGRNSEEARKEKDTSRSTSANKGKGSRSTRSSRNTSRNRSTSIGRNTGSRNTSSRSTGIQRGSGVSKREYNMQYSAQDELDNILKREADEIRKNDAAASENKFYTKSTDYGRIKPARNRYTNMDDLDNDIKKTQGFSDSIVQFRFDTTPYVNEKQAKSMKRMQQNVDDHKRELEIYKTDLMFGRAKFDEPGMKAVQPTNAYELDSIVNDARQKPVIQQNTGNTTTRQTSATPLHDREIAALQDELVNNPNMGYRDRQDYERMIGRLQEERATKQQTAVNPAARQTSATPQHDLMIAQLQDELVNNPDMGYRDKQDIENMIGRLKSERAEKTGHVSTASMVKGQSSGLTPSTKAEGSSIYDGDGRRRRETNQPSASTGTGHEYAQGTGGVKGNYKPPELREAEAAVTAFEIAFNKIEMLTGESDQATIMANIAEASLGIDGTIDESTIWGQSAIWLLEAEAEAGMTLGKAEAFLSDETAKFEVKNKIDSELEGEPQVTLVDWDNIESSGLNTDNTAQIASIDEQIQALKMQLADQEAMGIPGNVSKYDIKELERLKADLIEEDSKKQEIMSADFENLSLSELVLRGEYDYENMLKEFEQGVIAESLSRFEIALKKWEEGEDLFMKDIVRELYYDGDVNSNDIDLNEFNLNDMRDDFVEYAWGSGIFLPELATDLDDYITDITPSVMKQMSFEKIDNGYTFEVSPNFAEYCVEYVKTKEEMYKMGGDAATAGGVVAGVVATVATAGLSLPIQLIFGAAVSSVAAKWALKIGKKEDEYDDIGNSIAQEIRNNPETDKYMVVEVTFDEKGKPDVYSYLKED